MRAPVYDLEVVGDSDSKRLRRVIAVNLTVVLLVIGGTWEVLTVIVPLRPQLGGDFVFFRDIAERWIDTGTLYLANQLAGPYDVTLQVDNLYPPHALFLFVPFTVLPALLWWIVPLGITAYVIARLRPAPWSWPLLALLVLWPKTIIGVLWGNTDMWVVAAIAAGVRWHWPAVLVTVKPVFTPFALIGIRARSFWLATAVLAVVGLFMLPLWLDYVKVVRNASIPPEYLLRSVPTMFIPIVAWLGRRPGEPAAGPGLAEAGLTMHQDPRAVEAGSTRAEVDRR